MWVKDFCAQEYERFFGPLAIAININMECHKREVDKTNYCFKPRILIPYSIIVSICIENSFYCKSQWPNTLSLLPFPGLFIYSLQKTRFENKLVIETFYLSLLKELFSDSSIFQKKRI